MTFQSTRGPLKPLTLLRIPLYQLEKVSTTIWDGIKTPFIYYSNLKDENKALEKELGQFRMRQQEYEELKLENQRLTTLLDIKRLSPDFVATARVISSGIRQWPEIIIIDKGESSGIKKNMAVRTPEGLIGKTTDVMSRFSSVLLVTDVNFSVSVRLQDTRIEGILSGRGDGLCTLKYIPRDQDVETGVLLVTSGLDGVFPAGIPVGRITRVEKGDELFLEIEVQPLIKASKIEEVMVFKNKTKTYN